MAPENTIIPISIEEPQVTLDVTGKKINFLVDTRATYSVLNSSSGPLSSKSAKIMGSKETSRPISIHSLITFQFKSQYSNTPS